MLDKHTIRQLWAQAAFATFLATSNAQVKSFDAGLSGAVLDPSNALVPGASVYLRSGNKDVAQTTTDGTGQFRFSRVAPGRYEVRVDCEGFATQRVRLNIRASAPTPLRIVLAIADVKESLTVDTPPGQIRTDPGDNLDAVRLGPAELADLPLMDGDVIAALSKLLGPSALGSDGASILVDGLPHDGSRIPISEIQEITINNNPYSAEFARQGRARIEIITKSGSSAYHGSLGMVIRDYRLDGRNAFSAGRPPEDRRQFDATLSGPIHKSKQDTFVLTWSRIDDHLAPSVYALGLNGPILENASRQQLSTYISAQFTRRFRDSALSFRYVHFDWSDRGEGTGGFVLPGTGADSKSRYHQLFTSFRTVITPKLLNELSVRLRKEDSSSSSEEPGIAKIVVLDAFTSGGAQVQTSGTESALELADVASWTHGRHLMKAGINVPAFSSLGSNDQSNFNGTFYFSSLQAYANATPFSFVEQTGDGHLAFWRRQIGVFVQDQIKIRPNLSLALGVRDDLQNYGPNDHAPAPRLGLAWAPAKLSKTAFRGGAGFFYDSVPTGTIADTLRLNGTRLLQMQLLNPEFPDPFSGAAPLSAIPPNIVRFSPTLKAPYDFQYSLGVERQLRKKLTLTTTWTAIRGVDLFRSRDVNAPVPPLYVASPDPLIGVLRQIESSGSSKSHSLQTTLRGNMSRYFSGMVIYEWGHAMNDTDGIGSFPANNWTTQGEWSRASFDTRHFFYVYGTFTAGKYFNLGLIFSANSGRPYNMTTGLDDYHDGLANARPPGVERNSLQGDGAATLDIRWSREFHLPLKEGRPSLVAGLDAFNVLNHVNYSKFSGDLASPLFGKPYAAAPARRLQLSLTAKF